MSVVERLQLYALNAVYHDRIPENDRENMAVEVDSGFTPSTWLADSGASTHMTNSDEVMFYAKEINEQIRVGNGKSLEALKLGKVRFTVIQVNGVTKDVVLNDCKFVSALDMNLFSLVKSIHQEFTLGNRVPQITLSKGKISLIFD